MSQRQSAYSYSADPFYYDDGNESHEEAGDSDDQTSGTEHIYPYALTNRPSDMSDYRRISHAVEQLQAQYTASSTGSREAAGAQAQSQTLRLASLGLSPSANPLDGYQPHTIKYLDVAGREPSPGPSTSQRQATYLPTVDSGEPLDFDDFNPSNADSRDPFLDGTTQRRSASDHSSPNSRPNSQMSAYEASRRSSPTHAIQPPLPTYATSYTQRSSLHTPDRIYQRKGILPMHTGSPQYIDHFRHDTEAYASGTNSRPAFHTPKSRSPTPAIGEDDYDMGEEASIHYTGTTRATGDLGYHHEPLDEDEEFDDEDYDDEGEKEEEEKEKVQELLANEKGDTHPVWGKPPSLPDQPETPVATFHFGPAPTGRVLRRHKTKKRVQLTNGNLVIDLPVPPKLVLPRLGGFEVMKTRYTAVTCDPDDFEKRGFFLRQNELGRRTELFICVTMYNEDEILFCRTMYGVMRNISHLCSRKNSQTWGTDAWKKVVVCIVADGRKRIHPRVLDCLTLLGIYQPGGHMKNMINNKAVTAHLFEYTTSFALDPNLHFRYPDKGIVPTQIIFCMKEKNQKKINSHRWFFNAFGRMLQPNVCVLIDVGTRPGNKSIYHLWKTFDLNSNVGGACGEIAAYKGKNWSALLNPLVAAQNFEYKISNILDKPTESLFGYIGVLPGAFSAYRYIALQNDKSGRGPLASYFKGEVLHGRDTDIFTSNMYLAEDRILCFELVAKSNSSWVLRYVKGAVGETDVPDALPEFIGQRRRWLNGSFFAATYAIAHIPQMMRSGHSFTRKMWLLIQAFYNIINLIASWFAIGNYYLFFVILTSSLESQAFGMQWIRYVNSIVQYFMASIVIACFLLSMGNKPRSAKWKYKLITIFLAILVVYLLYAAVKCAIQAAHQGGTTYQVMLFSIIITYGVYTFASLLAFDPWHMFTSFIPYMLLSPMYINILNIYAFANLDDISWGTKEDSTPDTDLGAVIQDSHSQVDVEMLAGPADANALYEEAIQNLKHRTPVVRGGNGMTNAEKEQAAKDYYASVRTNVLLSWVLSNGLLLAGILGGGQSTATFSPDGGVTAAKAYMTFVLTFVGLTSIIRFLGSTCYLVARIFTG